MTHVNPRYEFTQTGVELYLTHMDSHGTLNTDPEDPSWGTIKLVQEYGESDWEWEW